MAVLTLSIADLERQTRLRRAKAFATGLLLVSAAVFLAVRSAADDGATWAGYVSAAAQAAMVGGLADWFAVTALFRRPLGLPIPHTALIPTRKDALGASLGSFVGDNFLPPSDPRRLDQVDVAGRVGAWLAQPGARPSGHRERPLSRCAARSRSWSDEDVRAVVEQVATAPAARRQVGPVLGRLLGQVVEDGSHHAAGRRVAGADCGVAARQPGDVVIRDRQNEAPAWSPAFVDRALATRVYAELLAGRRADRGRPRPPAAGHPRPLAGRSWPRTCARTRTRRERLQALVTSAPRPRGDARGAEHARRRHPPRRVAAGRRPRGRLRPR